MNVVLIGYRAVGKTTAGRRLASMLGWDFADCDERVEALAGCPVRELFETRGQQAFRALEHEVLAELVGADQLVVATGGGIVLDPRHPALLRQLGYVVWLTAPADTIAERVAASDRPRLTSLPLRDEIIEHMEQRGPLYASTAQATIDTTGSTVEQVASMVARLLPGALPRCC